MRTITLTLSGWGQPHDALKNVAPNAMCIDYARHNNYKAALLDIGARGKSSTMVIGWSLGGQMAVRAIAYGLLKPKKLVLIATPFQFVARPESTLGMPPDLFRAFRDSYIDNPELTLTKAWAAIVKGDKNATQILRHLEQQDKQALLEKNWLTWLDSLQNGRCNKLYLGNFPPTLLIHGDNDAVVTHAQSLAFSHAIPHATLSTLKGCGHAPHWHNPILIQQLITNFSHV